MHSGGIGRRLAVNRALPVGVTQLGTLLLLQAGVGGGQLLQGRMLLPLRLHITYASMYLD